MFQINSSGIEEAAQHLNFSDIGLSEAGLTILRVYNTLVILIGVLGNTLVLSGLLDHKVMTIDMTSRILLQNLAITDIFYTVFQFVPSLTTLLTGRWVFGTSVCLIDHIAANVFAINEIHAIMFLSIYRLWFIHQRLGRTPANPRHARWFVLAVFCHDVLVNVGYHLFYDTTTGYDHQVLSCGVLRLKNHTVSMIMGLYNIVIPIAITLVGNSITICTIMRIYTQKQSASRPYRKATLTILIISLAFLISYIPFFVQMFHPDKKSLPEWYRLTSMYSLSVNIVCNPFIYAIVDREFIGYIKELFLTVVYKFLVCVDWLWSKWYGDEGFDDELTSEFNSFEMVNLANMRGRYQYQPPDRTERYIPRQHTA